MEETGLESNLVGQLVTVEGSISYDIRLLYLEGLKQVTIKLHSSVGQ